MHRLVSFKVFMIISVLMIIFWLGCQVGARNYSDFNYNFYKEANVFKGDLLDYEEASLDIFYEIIYDKEMDTGKYDELIEDLEEAGLPTLRWKIDSLYRTQL